MPIVHGILGGIGLGTFDFETNVYRSVPPKDTAFLLKALKKIQDSGTEACVLDYVNSRSKDGRGYRGGQMSLASMFLSTPELDGACLGPQRRVARKILGLFGRDRLWETFMGSG